MEALRGTDFTGTPTSPSGKENGEDEPLPPPPTARCTSERDSSGGIIDRGGGLGTCGAASVGADGGDDGRDGGRGGGATGKGFFEFYPFLNDPAHNEMDGEAR